MQDADKARASCERCSRIDRTKGVLHNIRPGAEDLARNVELGGLAVHGVRVHAVRQHPRADLLALHVHARRAPGRELHDGNVVAAPLQVVAVEPHAVHAVLEAHAQHVEARAVVQEELHAGHCKDYLFGEFQAFSLLPWPTGCS